MCCARGVISGRDKTMHDVLCYSHLRMSDKLEHSRCDVERTGLRRLLSLRDLEQVLQAQLLSTIH